MSQRTFYLAFQSVVLPANEPYHWNSFDTISTNISSGLVDSTGLVSAYTLSLSSIVGVTKAGGGLNSPGSGDASWVNQATIVNERWSFVNNRTLTIGGLDNNKKYSVALFGSQILLADLRLGATINGETQEINTSGNLSSIIEFQSVSPESGEIVIALERPDGHCRLCAMRIVELKSVIPTGTHTYDQLSAYTTENFANPITSATVAGIACIDVSDTGATLPALADETTVPMVGDRELAVSDGEDTATASIVLSPPNDFNSVILGNDLNKSDTGTIFNFIPEAKEGDALLTPFVVDSEGNIIDAQAGSYIGWHLSVDDTDPNIAVAREFEILLGKNVVTLSEPFAEGGAFILQNYSGSAPTDGMQVGVPFTTNEGGVLTLREDGSHLIEYEGDYPESDSFEFEVYSGGQWHSATRYITILPLDEDDDDDDDDTSDEGTIVSINDGDSITAGETFEVVVDQINTADVTTFVLLDSLGVVHPCPITDVLSDTVFVCKAPDNLPAGETFVGQLFRSKHVKKVRELVESISTSVADAQEARDEAVLAKEAAELAAQTAGKSAYQIALDNGFIGDEVAWLESLQGEPGEPGTPGTPGEAGADGNDGTDGLSAYEIAVSEGFVGDISAWLASLKGEKGDPGADGADGTDGVDGVDGTDGLSAYEVAVAEGFIGTEGEWLASLKGEPGTGSGTVTSVGVAVPIGLEVAGSPVTGAGTITITFASGYSLPTTAKQTQWDTALQPNDPVIQRIRTLALAGL